MPILHPLSLHIDVPILPTRVLALGLALATLLLAGGAAAQAFNPGGTVFWYDPGDGSATTCQMGPTPIATAPFGLTAAISEADWNGREACGQFIELRTTASSCAGTPPFCNEELLTGDPVIVQINDFCPISGCPSGTFDLSAAAFETLAPTSVGTITDVEWRPVHGLFETNVRILNQAGNPFFPILTPIDHNVTIAKVEVTDPGLGAWVELPRTSFNTFQGSVPSALTLPYSVRVTGTNGEVLVGTNVITSFTQGDTFDVGAQFSPPAPVPIPPTVPLAIGLGALWLGRRALRERA